MKENKSKYLLYIRDKINIVLKHSSLWLVLKEGDCENKTFGIVGKLLFPFDRIKDFELKVIDIQKENFFSYGL